MTRVASVLMLHAATATPLVMCLPVPYPPAATIVRRGQARSTSSPRRYLVGGGTRMAELQ